MTEIERIIRKGVIPASFLEPEERCGFLVDGERKKLWAVLLDLLSEFDRVCRENNLRYYLYCGTLLGAVRHKGFIPWDDDIDVAMPREDYDRLMSMPELFAAPYFLQNAYTDPGYYVSFAKLRNTNTTFASKYLMHCSFNQGCFIDIFPCDEYEVENSDASFAEALLLCRTLGAVMKSANPEFKNKDPEIDRVLSEYTPLQAYERLESIAKEQKNNGTDFFSSLTSTITPWRDKAFPTSWFAGTEQMQFESLTLPVPSGYDHILTLLYADYMKFPSVKERELVHPEFEYHPDIPYSEFKANYDKFIQTNGR